MQIAVILLTGWIALSQATGQPPTQPPTQPPAQPPATQPPAKPPAAQTPRRQPAPPPITRTTLSVQVTDLEGQRSRRRVGQGHGASRSGESDGCRRHGHAPKYAAGHLSGAVRARAVRDVRARGGDTGEQASDHQRRLQRCATTTGDPGSRSEPAAPALPPAGPPTSVNLIELIETEFRRQRPLIDLIGRMRAECNRESHAAARSARSTRARRCGRTGLRARRRGHAQG